MAVAPPPGGALVADDALRQSARQYKDELVQQLFGVAAVAAGAGSVALSQALQPGSNIVGLGYGAKISGGSVGGPDEVAVRVYVQAKLPQATVPVDERVPPTVNGIPTDVIPLGDLAALLRPTACGVSVGHVNVSAGTLGCLVGQAGASPNDHFILSNNHVLADSNRATKARPQTPGDNILEPAPLDGGNPADPIAELTDFEPIAFGVLPPGTKNVIDAAIARVLDPADVTADILGGIGRVQQPIMTASLFQSVRKHGRTTRHTVGVIMDLAADIKVRYGTQVAMFEDQVGIVGAGGVFSAGGDSGSLIVDAVTRRAMGLLFAGGGGLAFANRIDPVLLRFNASII
jgi:hypothetical protein